MTPLAVVAILMAAATSIWAMVLFRQKRLLAERLAETTAACATLTESDQALADKLQRSQTALRDQQRELQNVEAQRNELLANVSHELRTPLTSICGYVEILEQRTADPSARDLLAKVSRNAQALVVLINKVLDLSKLNAGRLELTIAPVPLEECLEAAYCAVEPQLLAKGLAFRLELPDNPVILLGSFKRLQQIFSNLLGNAVKFTLQGEVGVSVQVQEKMAELRFWDTGVGIPADRLGHIFDDFTQADSSVRRQFGGSGLGLAICRKLVELHQGKLRVESTQGEGSTFIVELPMHRRQR